jgi:hypothetical protein
MDAKVTFPYRFQDQAKGVLHNPVKQGWDAKRPLFLTVWFRDVHPSYWHGFKRLGFECFSEAIDIAVEVSEKVRLRHAVDTCRVTSLVFQGFVCGHS